MVGQRLVMVYLVKVYYWGSSKILVPRDHKGAISWGEDEAIPKKKLIKEKSVDVNGQVYIDIIQCQVYVY